MKDCHSGAPALETPRGDILRRLIGWVLLAVVGLGACSKKPSPNEVPASSSGPAPAIKLRLALNWVPEPEFGGFYAAREEGSYRKHGIDLEILGGGAGSPVLQVIATGRADFGIVGADDVVIGKARGADIVGVFAAFQKSPQGIMVHAARKLTRIEQVFRSGTLALETGQPYAEYLKQKYSWNGVKIVPYDGGVARFLADPEFAQQCYVTSEPLAAKRQGGDPQVFLVADSGYNPYTTLVITRRELLQQKPELVRAFVAATVEGWQSYLTNPRKTNAVLGKLNGAMDDQALAAAAEAQRPLIDDADAKKFGLGSMQRARWETLVNQLADLKLIERKPAVDDLFVNLR